MYAKANHCCLKYEDCLFASEKNKNNFAKLMFGAMLISSLFEISLVILRYKMADQVSATSYTLYNGY